MKIILMYILYIPVLIRALPLLLFYLFSKNKVIVNEDIKKFIVPIDESQRKEGVESNNFPYWAQFIFLLNNNDAFRNIFYMRIKKAKIFQWLFPPLNSLYLHADEIGPGFLVIHGFSSIVTGKIGKNCTLLQQVTIGHKKAGDGPPVIGDNVTICAGAKILGKIKVGDNVVIGANAVVIKDVPSNCVVAGVPAKIVKKINEGYNIKPV